MGAVDSGRNSQQHAQLVTFAFMFCLAGLGHRAGNVIRSPQVLNMHLSAEWTLVNGPTRLVRALRGLLMTAKDPCVSSIQRCNTGRFIT
jgi:hypothetical protein